LVLGEESNSEYSCYYNWDQGQTGNWYIPPMDVFIEEGPENSHEKEKKEVELECGLQ
jgi:hypothetical protein